MLSLVQPPPSATATALSLVPPSYRPTKTLKRTTSPLASSLRVPSHLHFLVVRRRGTPW
ncbi:hypothetical protein C8R44DRAFT_763264 [Mycena epipterygia]|nr:hypothetical protein C8R44DRAFT_763264 [Mycena epipterygia]